MAILNVLAASPLLFIGTVGIIGLLVGSFLNVVIHRLPMMMEREWRKECTEFLELDQNNESSGTFNLILPASHCPGCNVEIKAYQNIPVLSYLLLKGRCSNCNTRISIRYPIIEACTGLMSVIVSWHFGYGIETLYALILTWSLIALSAIDIDHQLLPDSITLPLLWLGLILSLFSIFTDSHSSIVGAVAGYLTLWTVFQLFKLTTGKEGMGFGDFKLLALFGAWLGWQYLPVIILFASFVGACIGILMGLLAKRDLNIPIPFGPYLATAGWIALLWGDNINQYYLTSVGF